MSLDGLNDVMARINAAIQQIEGVTEQGIKDVGNDLLRRSVQLAPVDTTDLRVSGKVEFEDNGKTAVVSFNTEYAVIQHENLEFNHPNGGQAKYLQQPFEENVDKYIDHLRDTARRVL